MTHNGDAWIAVNLFDQTCIPLLVDLGGMELELPPPSPSFPFARYFGAMMRSKDR